MSSKIFKKINYFLNNDDFNTNIGGFTLKYGEDTYKAGLFLHNAI